MNNATAEKASMKVKGKDTSSTLSCKPSNRLYVCSYRQAYRQSVVNVQKGRNRELYPKEHTTPANQLWILLTKFKYGDRTLEPSKYEYQ